MFEAELSRSKFVLPDLMLGEDLGEKEAGEDDPQWCGVERSQPLAVVPLNSKSNLCFVRKDVRGLGKEKVVRSPSQHSDLSLSNSGNCV